MSLFNPLGLLYRPLLWNDNLNCNEVVFEDGLAGGFAGRIESPVYDFFLEDGEEAFAPRIVSRSADIRETLLPTVFRYLCHHVISCVLAPAIAAMPNSA